MKMSKLYMPTLREVPSEAELPSHQLLLRAGMIRKLVSGVYSYLPLGIRVLKKVEKIVREEMDAIDSQEVLMSAIQPAELWKESGRWDDFGPEMFRLYDRNQREFCLGPTHEEIFTDLIRHEVKSYKQLPLSLYQIQTKYRDEKRPRFGLMRAREFIMKDAYTFDIDEEGMRKSYEDMWKAYEKIFTRCGLNFKVVEGDSGAMGGSDSHEFMAMSEYGESAIAYCDSCDYAATDEKANCLYEVEGASSEKLQLEKAHTPNAKTIEEVSKFFNTSAESFVKTLLYMAKDKVVAVLIPGNRELNEIKLVKVLEIPEHELIMADAETVKAVTGAEVGFAGPINLKKDIRVIVDSRVTKMSNFIVGANETDYHIKNVNYGRDFEGEVVEDLLLVQEGDKCPKCGAPLKTDRGIEVGNIFQLGLKYSSALNATFLDENGKEKKIYMGSHGVGVSRTAAAVIEQCHDENGIIWPLALAPYHAIITVVNVKSEEQTALGESLYSQLSKLGLEVLIDDRNERAGVKFKDADLIGIPIRITVGKRANEEIVEFSLRRDGEKTEINVNEIMDKIKAEFSYQGLEL
ncbi:proline--tRNA ligase [Proteiniborus sp. MB09-C3]|uniref:proline--tRNA ligase n=1 Tax=Proteiniborus sp. MB09-C3 TaxID=3050072 RepID=UPI0025575748|nr:proline--tRNA ligase [Proteiniborus sp. MB09-C3]WIV13120.1 proline--tRNA ligase [Proteiniborus sp. MB09-C3]